MALTRSMLKGMGLTEEQVSAVIEEHENTISGLKSVRDNYKAEAEKIPDLQKQVESLQKKLDSGQMVSKSEYDKIVAEKDKLSGEFETFKSEQTAKEEKLKKSTAYRKLLKDAGISEKHLDAVMRVSDLDEIELGEDGKIKNFEKLTENAKTEWGDFITTSSSEGAGTETPPKNIGGDSGSPSRAALLTKQYHENLYGKIKED